MWLLFHSLATDIEDYKYRGFVPKRLPLTAEHMPADGGSIITQGGLELRRSFESSLIVSRTAADDRA